MYYLLCLTSKCRLFNKKYEHIKQKMYTQNLFPIRSANLTLLDNCFAMSWENPSINNTNKCILSCCCFDVNNSGIEMSINGNIID